MKAGSISVLFAAEFPESIIEQALREHLLVERMNELHLCAIYTRRDLCHIYKKVALSEFRKRSQFLMGD